MFVVLNWSVLACEPEDAMEDTSAISVLGTFIDMEMAIAATQQYIKDIMEEEYLHTY